MKPELMTRCHRCGRTPNEKNGWGLFGRKGSFSLCHHCGCPPSTNSSWGLRHFKRFVISPGDWKQSSVTHHSGHVDIASRLHCRAIYFTKPDEVDVPKRRQTTPKYRAELLAPILQRLAEPVSLRQLYKLAQDEYLDFRKMTYQAFCTSMARIREIDSRFYMTKAGPDARYSWIPRQACGNS